MGGCGKFLRLYQPEHTHHNNGIAHLPVCVGDRCGKSAQPDAVLTILYRIAPFAGSDSVGLQLFGSDMGVRRIGNRLQSDHLPHQVFIPCQKYLPLRRTVQHSIEDAAAELLLDGKARSGDSIAAVVCGGGVKLSVAV